MVQFSLKFPVVLKIFFSCQKKVLNVSNFVHTFISVQRINLYQIAYTDKKLPVNDILKDLHILIKKDDLIIAEIE